MESVFLTWKLSRWFYRIRHSAAQTRDHRWEEQKKRRAELLKLREEKKKRRAELRKLRLIK